MLGLDEPETIVTCKDGLKMEVVREGTTFLSDATGDNIQRLRCWHPSLPLSRLSSAGDRPYQPERRVWKKRNFDRVGLGSAVSGVHPLIRLEK